MELPASPESERILIGSMLTYREVFDETRDIITQEMFTDPFCRQLYQFISELHAKGEEHDIIAIYEQSRAKNAPVNIQDLTDISELATINYIQHACIVADKHRRRRLYLIATEAAQEALRIDIDTDDTLNKTREKIDGLHSIIDNNVLTMKEAVAGVYEMIKRNSDGDKITGDPIGLNDFDKYTGGLQTTDLIVVAADTSMGKTSLAIKMAMSVGCPCAFYSMEMKATQIAARMMSIKSGIPANGIQFHKLEDYQIARIDKTVQAVLGLKLYFDDRSTSSIDSILNSIRSLKAKYKIHGAFIDYLQILNVNMKTTSKEQQMGEVARRLKNLAKELDIWIVALSQLNRSKESPQPTLARIRDSGQIAEAADMVIMIYRPSVYGLKYTGSNINTDPNGTALINVAKGRNSGVLKFICDFDPTTTEFRNRDEARSYAVPAENDINGGAIPF